MSKIFDTWPKSEELHFEWKPRSPSEASQRPEKGMERGSLRIIADSRCRSAGGRHWFLVDNLKIFIKVTELICGASIERFQ